MCECNILLIVVVDKVVVSGGYMMVCVVNKIVFVFFVIIGFVGVVVEVLNIYCLFKKYDVDVDVMMVGEFKCIVIFMGENIEKGK